MHTNAFDTNGTIQKYFYNDNQGWKDTTNIDSSDGYQVRFSDINHAYLLPFTFGVRDDDMLLTQKNFVVFADSAPPVPALGSATISSDSVKLVWENADFKDGDSTQFQILFDLNNPPTTIIKSFAACKKVGTEFYYWYHPAASGRYRFKVISKDARGTQSASGVSSYFDFTKP